MKSSVTYTSDTRAVVTITLDAKDLSDAEQVALKKLASTIKVNGFRKGHAPIALVKKNVDPNALNQETVENALSKSVAEAFLRDDIQALQRPEVDIKKYVPGEMMQFTAEADVLPKITLGDYTKLAATRKPVTVSLKDVDEVVDRIRKGFAEKKVTNDAAKLEDEAVIDFVGKTNGVSFDGGSGTDYPLTLGSGAFIPGFEEAIVGLKSGDKKDIEVTFPKDYHVKKLAGQKATFETTVKMVHKVVLPELTDEFAAKVGPFTSVDELRADIKRELIAQKEREATDELKNSLVKQLVECSKVSVPEVLRKDQLHNIEQDLQQNLQYQGVSFEQYLKDKGYADRDAWVKAEAAEVADERIKAGLVLAELSKKLKIQATSDELAENLNRYRESYANKPDMAQQFDSPEIQREVGNRLITEKTVDALVELNMQKKSKSTTDKNKN